MGALTIPMIIAIVQFLQGEVVQLIKVAKSKNATPEEMAALWKSYDDAHAAAMDAKATF